MATLQAATTRHHHTELFSGILTNQCLLHPCLGVGKKGFQRSTEKIIASNEAMSSD